MKNTYFGTDGVRGTFGVTPITPEYFEKMGRAYGKALKETHGAPSVIMGRDTRSSGPVLEAALSRGLRMEGVTVMRAGIAPTPAIAYLTIKYQMHGGIVVSASHNPACDNGVKFFNADGRKIPDALQASIVKYLQEELPPASVLTEELFCAYKGPIDYIDFCVEHAKDVNLSNMTLMVDAANGAAVCFAHNIFTALGAKVLMMGDKPNGDNINDGVGATDVAQLKTNVLKNKTDLGLAFDGDADRLVVVNSKGEELNGDAILFALVKDRLKTGTVPGVAGTIMSNSGLELSLKKLGVPLVRTKVGDRYLAQALHENNWDLGAEDSGHILDLSKLPTGDGLLAAVLLLKAIAGDKNGLEGLLDGLEMLPKVTINVHATDADRQGWNWEQDPSVVAAKQTVEQALQGRGRWLMRPSGTEPCIRATVEAPSQQQAAQLAQVLANGLAAAIKSRRGN